VRAASWMVQTILMRIGSMHNKSLHSYQGTCKDTVGTNTADLQVLLLIKQKLILHYLGHLLKSSRMRLQYKQSKKICTFFMSQLPSMLTSSNPCSHPGFTPTPVLLPQSAQCCERVPGCGRIPN